MLLWVIISVIPQASMGQALALQMSKEMRSQNDPSWLSGAYMEMSERW